MVDTLPQHWQRSMRHVRNRLTGQFFLRTLFVVMPVCLLALLVCLTAFLWIRIPISVDFRWILLGLFTVLGVILSLAFALWNYPTTELCAAEIDLRFGLKERLSTYIWLDEKNANTLAGQALRDDLQNRSMADSLSQKFPIKLSWPAISITLFMLGLSLLMVIFDIPMFNSGEPNLANLPMTPLGEKQAEVVAENRQKLQKLVAAQKQDQAELTKEMKEILADIEKVTKEDLDPNDPEDVREQVQKIRDVEQKIQERIDRLQGEQERKRKLAQELAQMEKAFGKKNETPDGPAKDLMEALKKGDAEKIDKEIAKLQEQMENQKIDEEQQKKLQEQIEALQNRLPEEKQLAQKQEALEKQLEKFAKENQPEGNSQDKEKLAQEKKEIQNQLNNLETLKEVAKNAKECQQCLKQGDGKKAAEKLAQMAKDMKDLNGQMQLMQNKLNEDEKKQIAKMQANRAQLQQIREQMLAQLDNQNRNQNGKDGMATGPRPSQETDPTKSVEERTKGEFNKDTQLTISGYRSGGSFKKIPAKQMHSSFRESQQRAQEVIEQQRIVPQEAEILRQYFEKLSGEKSK